MKRTPVQQMREELLNLVNNYFDRAEARMKQQKKKLQQRQSKHPEPAPREQVDPSEVLSTSLQQMKSQPQTRS